MSALDILLELKTYPNERDEIEAGLEEIYEKQTKPKLKDLVTLLEKEKIYALPD